MAIEELDIDAPEAEISDKLAQLIETCSRDWERFFADSDDHDAPGFVPSVPEIVFSVLQEVTERELPPNRVFCEWGSGFGTATCMAALLGYEAYGVEIEEELVRRSRAIARRLGISVEIICASMFPKGYRVDTGAGGAELMQPKCDDDARPLRYDGMKVDIAEVGLFFVYPWAYEQELIVELFDAVAAEGAILLSYHHDKKVCIFRKTKA